MGEVLAKDSEVNELLLRSTSTFRLECRWYLSLCDIKRCEFKQSRLIKLVVLCYGESIVRWSGGWLICNIYRRIWKCSVVVKWGKIAKYVVGINLWSDLSGGSCPKWLVLIDTYIPVTVMTADEPAAPTDFKISMVYHKNYRRDSGKGDDVW